MAPAGPVSVTPAPLQITPSLAVPDVSLAVMVGADGLALTVIELLAVAVQPLLVTVTVYGVVVPGFTVIAAVVALVLHK